MIRIAIVDDHAVVRAGLQGFLADFVDLRVVAEGASAAAVMPAVVRDEVDVVLLDLSMPGQNGVDALQALRAHAPLLPVLILSGLPEEHFGASLIRQGAAGYLNKGCDPDEIVRAVRTVAIGRRFISPRLAERLFKLPLAAAAGREHVRLSERELQVFLQLAKGRTLTGIASEMGLSVKTVSTYRTRLLQKMLLQSNSDLTHYALRSGLIE